MIVIGIPTYNEAVNITRLVGQIDKAASSLKLPVVIINADNNSPDGTAAKFNSVLTANPKVSLITKGRGKGRNIRAIFEYVTKHYPEAPCLFIDGDIVSFEPAWLERHAEALTTADLTMPDYSRYWFEGNGTNQFAYPLLSYWAQGCPSQPLAGDVGVSAKLIKYLSQQPWPASTSGYGIDILICMHALMHGFKVKEVKLSRKIHNPSFDKMVAIFLGEAECYYSLREIYSHRVNSDFASNSRRRSFLDGASISQARLQKRIKEAREFAAVHPNSAPGLPSKLPKAIGYKDWVAILLAHERLVGKMPAAQIAESLCPYYLIRVVTYLRETGNKNAAMKEISAQQQWLDQTFCDAALGL